MDNLENVLRHEKYFLYRVGLKYYMIGKNLCARVLPNQLLLTAHCKYEDGDERYESILRCPVCVFAYKEVVNRLIFIYESGKYEELEHETVFSEEEQEQIKKQYTALIEFEKQHKKYIN